MLWHADIVEHVTTMRSIKLQTLQSDFENKNRFYAEVYWCTSQTVIDWLKPPGKNLNQSWRKR